MQRNLFLILLLAVTTLSSFERKSQSKKPFCGPWVNIVNNGSVVIRSFNVTDDYGTILYSNVSLQPGQSYFTGQWGGPNFSVKIIHDSTFHGSVSVSLGSNEILCQNMTAITTVSFQTTTCATYDVKTQDGSCELQ